MENKVIEEVKIEINLLNLYHKKWLCSVGYDLEIMEMLKKKILPLNKKSKDRIYIAKITVCNIEYDFTSKIINGFYRFNYEEYLNINRKILSIKGNDLSFESLSKNYGKELLHKFSLRKEIIKS